MTIYNIFTYIGIAAFILTLLRYFLAKPHHLFISFLQHFVGALFIFSGFVKAVDPMGTSIKMHEYFEAMHIEFMNPFSTAFSVAMITIEIVLGVAVIIGWREKLTATLLLLMTLFFTLLTGFTYLSGYSPSISFWILFILSAAGLSFYAISENSTLKKLGLISGFGGIIIMLVGMKFSNLLFTEAFTETKMKVTDCGCFGDFIKLKPWETFWKDVFLDVVILVLALEYRKIARLFTELPRSIITYGTLIISLLFCLYNFVWNEPVIDFRPYKIGSDINEMRRVIKPEVKDYVFVYRNKTTNEEKEFKTAELGNLTEDWEYVSRKDIVLDPGIPAKITNLYIFNEDKEEITDDLLNDSNYSLVVISYKLSNTYKDCFANHLNKLAEESKKEGITFYGISSDDAAEFISKNNVPFNFYAADETPLKTIIRSNPGLLLLKNGVVVNKWHRKHLPTFEKLNQEYFKK
jgi:uncharacterized membrane protein YphA (DoxX/SURF4 family)